MAKKTNRINPNDPNNWKEITLPSGVKAEVRTKITMGDIVEAQRRLGEKGTQAEMAMVLVARICKIEGEPIVMEDVQDWPPADFAEVMKYVDMTGFQNG